MENFAKKLKEGVSSLAGASQDKPELRIIKLGAEVGATKNMTVYECGEEMIIVDCGIGFPDDEMLGIDVVIPDFTYVLENQHKLKGVFVSHGHEDHFGAIPFLLSELNTPIYCNQLVQAFLTRRLEDRATKEVAESAEFHLFNSTTPAVKFKHFELSAFHVNHSVPDSLGIVIKTPQGTVVHMADYKIDFSPVIDAPFEFNKLTAVADSGILCLVSDCLGANHDGHSASERTLAPTLNRLVAQSEGKQIFLTTISSNISRMYQVIEAAIANNRKVVTVGYSIGAAVEIARNLELLPFDKEVFVDLKHAKNYSPNELLYIVAGCYGQQGSALYRLAHKEHKQLEIQQGDLVIFSADPGPPTSYVAVEDILHYLTVAGADVIYSKIQDNLHVSGHGTRGDLETVACISKAKYFVPIGGTAAHMRAYKHMVEDLGYDSDTVFEMTEGNVLTFSEDSAAVTETIEVKQVYIDGSLPTGLSDIVLKDREMLSADGVFVVIVPMSKDKTSVVGSSEVVTRGFVYVKENKALVGQAKDLVNKQLDKANNSAIDWPVVKSGIEKDVRKYLQKETGRDPLVIVTAIGI
ncbi:MAG: ribonuclease J [Patescibacteria group bacterium]|uniref:Ribonuclease J n=1 Tax=candidate division WWE3 bacterium TaxID=2053526 RepID=A0A955J2K3_UNCKA|nr:ribonuclease J [candidate division WWE3 bacterium]